MKTFIKKSVSVILVFLMMFSGISAFAQEDKTVEWNFEENEGNSIVLPYTGELTGPVEVGNNDYFGLTVECFGFTAETAGYYCFTAIVSEDAYYDMFTIPETYSDGKAYGSIDCDLSFSGDNKRSFIYYVPEGETVVLIKSLGKSTISCEFLGEEATDVEFDENTLWGIVDYDFLYISSSKTMIGDVGGKIIFSSGKNLEFDSLVLDVKSDGKIKKGENKAVAECLGLEKDIVITGYEATDFVTSLEPVDIKDDLYMVEYYNGYYSEPTDGIEAKVIINYADGTQETVDFNDGYTQIVISDSRQYPVRISYNPEHRVADLLFADCKYESYKIDIVPASYEDNLKLLKHECSYFISNANYKFNYCITMLENTDNFTEKLSLVFSIPEIYSNAVFRIFGNVTDFIEYYI